MKLKAICLNIGISLGLMTGAHAVHAGPISGTYAGTFINPVPTSPPAVTTGLGTSRVTWGIPCNGRTNCLTSPGGITPPSSFTFAAVPFVTEIGEPFVLGQISFFNGTIQPGTQLDRVTLFLNGFQITPTQFAGSDSRIITIVNTPNTGDPIASSDRATIPMAFFPGANEFGVLESQSATATLLGMFEELTPRTLGLDILGYGAVVSGGGFLQGFAPAPPTPTPEPSAIALMGMGLAGMGLLGWRKRCRNI